MIQEFILSNEGINIISLLISIIAFYRTLSFAKVEIVSDFIIEKIKPKYQPDKSSDTNYLHQDIIHLKLVFRNTGNLLTIVKINPEIMTNYGKILITNPLDLNHPNDPIIHEIIGGGSLIIPIDIKVSPRIIKKMIAAGNKTLELPIVWESLEKKRFLIKKKKKKTLTLSHELSPLTKP